MKKSITISIPEPCHEDWDKMTATERGKFCKVCTKEVVDFTNATDEDLVKRIQKGANLCGRFRKSQLDRPVTLERKTGNSLLPYAASFLLPLSILSHQDTQAHSDPPIFNNSGISLNVGGDTEKSIVIISGQVTDESGMPIPHVEVLVIETGKSTWTNAEGNYKLECPSGSTLSFLHSEKLSHEVMVGTKNSIVHAVLKAAPEVNIPHILGKIAPIETLGDIQIIEKIEEEETQKIKTTGTVTDDAGFPLPGVNIVVKGTANGTQTDFEGNYSITTEPNQALVFTYIGFETKEIALSNLSNDISISLEPDISGFLGIVVVGGISSTQEVEVIESPLERSASWDEEQWANQEKRQDYTAKENAFKKVRQERAKANRKAKRALRRKK